MSVRSSALSLSLCVVGMPYISPADESSSAARTRLDRFGRQAVHEPDHVLGDGDRLLLDREVTGVEEMKLGLRKVPEVRLRPGREEGLVVLSPHNQRGRLQLPEEGLPGRIGVDVGLIILEQLDLDSAIPAQWREGRGRGPRCPGSSARHAPLERPAGTAGS